MLPDLVNTSMLCLSQTCLADRSPLVTSIFLGLHSLQAITVLGRFQTGWRRVGLGAKYTVGSEDSVPLLTHDMLCWARARDTRGTTAEIEKLQAVSTCLRRLLLRTKTYLVRQGYAFAAAEEHRRREDLHGYLWSSAYNPPCPSGSPTNIGTYHLFSFEP